MKKLVALTGFAAGILIALVILLRSPFSPQLLSLPSNADTLQWQALEFAGNPFTPAGVLGLPAGSRIVPVGSPQVALANVSIMLLYDGAGQPVALATRLASRRKGGNLFIGNIGIDTYTNVLWPNRGSILMHGYEDRTPMLRASALGKNAMSPDDAFAVSAVPPKGVAQGVVGGSGELIGSSGQFSETLWQTLQQPGNYSGTLTIELAPAQ
jgi:hypothetical protein